MSDCCVIRPALPTTEDAAALLAVERATLADSPYTPEEVRAVLARPEQHAWLAIAGQEAVGFLSCLETPAHAGRRLELDMLGVRADYRGRGLATHLLTRAITEAQCHGIPRARGVTHEDNPAAQRAFERAGLTAAQDRFEMRVYPIAGTVPLPLPEGFTSRALRPGEEAHVLDGGAPWRSSGEGSIVLAVADSAGSRAAFVEALHVHTLAYKGLWIERLRAPTTRALRAALRAIIEEAKRRTVDEVGYLAPPAAASEPDARTAWFREGFVAMGRYRVYHWDDPGSAGDMGSAPT